MVITASGEVLSVDGAGRVRPIANIGEPPTAGPVLSGDTLIVGTFYGNLYFLTLSGEVLFRDSLGFPVRGVAVGGGTFAVSEDGKVVRYVGTYRSWIRYLGDNVLVPPSITPDGRVVVATLSGNLTAYDTSGNVVWTVEGLGLAPSPPSVMDSVVALGFPDGRVLLITPSGYGEVEIGAGTIGEVTLSDSGAFVSTSDGRTVRVRGDSIIWRFSPGSEWMATSPLLFDTFAVVVSGDGILYALSYSGQILDTVALNGTGWLEPLPTEGGIFLVSEGGVVSYVSLAGSLPEKGWPLYRGDPERKGSPYGSDTAL